MNELVENPVALEEIQEPPFEVWYYSLLGKFLIKDSRGKYIYISREALKIKSPGVASRLELKTMKIFLKGMQ